MSLRLRLILLTVGATFAGCVALIVAAYLINQMEVAEAIRGRATAISKRLELFVAEGSSFQTQESVERLLESDAFVAAVVFSPGREILASAPASADLEPVLTEWPEDESTTTRTEILGVESVVVSVPLVTGGRVKLAFDRSPYAAAEKRMRLAWAGAGAGVMLITLVIAFVVAGSTRKRLTEIRATLERLAEGDLEARCDAGGPGEIEGVAHSVNQMAEKMGAVIKELGNERTALEQQVSGRTRELEQANRLLMDIANRDALTGLANRRRLEMELERNISFSKRTGQPLAVIMMDLDKFKICNDTAGHLVGDNILRAVASTLRSRVRVTDLVVRWGGDEFCILVPATQPQGAIAAAESLVDAVKEATTAIALPEPLEPPTASAGVACFPEDGEDPHTLILNADAALYQVKATGRGRVLRYSAGFSKD
jgi:diguanylate cyclase (GGDEF)-like protein